MLAFERRQRRVLVEKLPDTANGALARLLFGQAFRDGGFSLPLAMTAIVVWVALMWCSTLLARRN